MISSTADTDRDLLARDGVVCLRRAIAPEWVERLQAATADALSEPAPHANRYGAKAGEAAFYSEVGIHRRLPAFGEFGTAGPLLPLAAYLMDSTTLNLYGSQLLVKEAGSSAPTPWHHDLPYFRMKGSKAISLWCALDVINAENGMVEYVRGSHLSDKLYRPVEFGEDTRFKDMTLDRVPDIDGHRDQYDIVSFEMQPGDVVAFHVRTLHGAPANRSSRSRRAFSVRYAGDDVVYHELPGMPPTPHFKGGLQPGDKLDPEAFPLVWTGKTQNV